MVDSIHDYARTLVKRGQVRVTAETDKKVYFAVYSHTANADIEVVYQIIENTFLPCLSKHGDTPLGGWIQGVQGNRCRHMLACVLLMEQNGMRDRFDLLRARSEAGL